MTAPTLAQRFACWPALQQHQQRLQQISLLDLFAANPQRVNDCSIEVAGLRLDYSKNHIDKHSFTSLIQLAEQAALPKAIQALLDGAQVNNTEKRAAMHTALRSPKPVMEAENIADAFKRMTELVQKVHSGEWRGYSNETIADVVNIGIGGSDLGPQMATHALKPFYTGHVRLHFVSNVDPSCLQDLLVQLDPARTLFIVASKSFTTLETLQNALAARRWLLAAAPDASATARHFVAVSSAIKKAENFGIETNNILPMWDWVGGRYSLWSAIGLPIALAVGMEHFNAMLAGAFAMDEHFRTAPLEKNMPVITGLLGFWYQHFWQANSHVVLPYDHYLRFFPDYLQQLDMESNGKHVNRSGEDVPYATGPVIWGAVGTNGQHSFHQLLHQGTHCIPADFILTLRSHHKDCTEQHRHLLANGLAQSQALMCGKSLDTVETELRTQGLDDTDIAFLAPHKVITGNRPSNIIAMDLLTPATLGALIALYEHKVYVQSVLWNINPFDQWGVELGKQLSGPIFGALSEKQLSGDASELDLSTAAVIADYHHFLSKK
ncbi:MAG TPA: glucose-6-phosphate isomerase [Pseudomonadales bacterium]|nr:glucose-6-phosphate isomerase [Pseudomonadales bacterium]